jgi:hypothetical protein
VGGLKVANKIENIIESPVKKTVNTSDMGLEMTNSFNLGY